MQIFDQLPFANECSNFSTYLYFLLQNTHPDNNHFFLCLNQFVVHNIGQFQY